MKEIITVINQKGGVGKSTTTHAFGAGLTKKGYRVLYIDLDAQANLTSTIGADNKINALDVLIGKVSSEQAIQHAKGGDIIAGSPNLAVSDTVTELTLPGKEHRLKEAIVTIHDKYDYIVIDTPPALGILTVNALTASTGCIIPAQADVYSLQGISNLYNTIYAVIKYCNPNLKVKGIVLTRFNSQTIIGREVAEMVRDTANEFSTKLYETKIRECTAIKECQAVQEDIYEYAPKSNAALDYASLVEEVLKGE